MRRVPLCAACAALGLLLLTAPAGAEAASETECPDKAEEGTPGSSPDTAITIQYFHNLMAFALYEARSELAVGVAGGEKHFNPNCKWVRLTGVFNWMDYRGYRGRLYENTRSLYLGSEGAYVIEDFGDPSTRRGDLHRRRITLTGRFFNLCAEYEPVRETPEGDVLVSIGGLCHYGEANGMLLQDVIIEKVHDDAPRFLSGEQNRDVFRELVPYKDEDREILIGKTRDWAALVKKGARAYARETVAAAPAYAAKYPDRAERFREFATDENSYVSYLSALPAFRKMNPDRAQVAVFGNAWIARRVRENHAVGCICLVEDCADRWPLLYGDAEHFLGAAACTGLKRSGEDSAWRWWPGSP